MPRARSSAGLSQGLPSPPKVTRRSHSIPARCACTSSISATRMDGRRPMQDGIVPRDLPPSVLPLEDTAPAPSRGRKCRKPRGAMSRKHAPVTRFPSILALHPARFLPYVPSIASGCSSGVEHYLAKVRVGRSNRLTRSNFSNSDAVQCSATFVSDDGRCARRRGPGVGRARGASAPARSGLSIADRTRGSRPIRMNGACTGCPRLPRHGLRPQIRRLAGRSRARPASVPAGHDGRARCERIVTPAS